MPHIVLTHLVVIDEYCCKNLNSMRFSHLCKSGVKYARAINMKGVGWAKEGTVGWRYHKRASH